MEQNILLYANQILRWSLLISDPILKEKWHHHQEIRREKCKLISQMGELAAKIILENGGPYEIEGRRESFDRIVNDMRMGGKLYINLI